MKTHTPPTSDAIAQAITDICVWVDHVAQNPLGVLSARMDIAKIVRALCAREIAAQPGEGEPPMWFPLLGTPFAIRWEMLNDVQAKRNHDQSLKRLAERGGLSPSEAIAVIEKRQWRHIVPEAAYAAMIVASPPHVADALDGERIIRALDAWYQHKNLSEIERMSYAIDAARAEAGETK